MPLTPPPPPPFVLPSSLDFFYNDESSLTQKIYIYNPFSFDITFKVDNGRPRRFTLSSRHGVVSAQRKVYVEITCRQPDECEDEKVQFRFFKLPRPRHTNGKNLNHYYIGIREVRLCVFGEHGVRELTPSTDSDSASVGASSGRGAERRAPSQSSASSYQRRQRYPGERKMVDDFVAGHHRSQKLQVLMNLGVTVILLLLGFLLNNTDPAWFSLHILGGMEPHTLSIVFYNDDEEMPRPPPVSTSLTL